MVASGRSLIGRDDEQLAQAAGQCVGGQAAVAPAVGADAADCQEGLRRRASAKPVRSAVNSAGRVVSSGYAAARRCGPMSRSSSSRQLASPSSAPKVTGSTARYALPDGLRASRTAEALEAIVDLDLADLAECESPRGYGRD